MISKLYVDFNSKVTQGQVIAEIDPKLFQGGALRVDSAIADLYRPANTSIRRKTSCTVRH
jgi:multidrug resistance efflux pump